MGILQTTNSSPIDESFWEGGFDLSCAAARPAKTLEDKVRPYVTTPEAWKNYTDDFLYQADKDVREWMEVMSESKQWMRSWKERRYDLSGIWWAIYGIAPENDQKFIKHRPTLSHLYSYYCSTVKKGYTPAPWAYTKHPTRMYVISSTRYKKPPYSLRLRIEWLIERGEAITFDNMEVPQPLKVGHSRNQRTQAGIKRRSEIARKASREYLAKWREDTGRHGEREENRDD